MAIVMGLDQHRAQITAEWIDTDTGELGRGRISLALRGDVRRFFKRFAGQQLEVALERRRVGASSPRNCARSAPRSISPSRPRRRRGGGTRSAPRPIAPTRGTCASC
jgi:hypothetical protein